MSLKRDNVRLGLPADLQKARIKQGQTRRSLEDFSIWHLADSHFFHQADAQKNSDRASDESDVTSSLNRGMSILRGCCTRCAMTARFARLLAKVDQLSFKPHWSAV